MNEERKRKSTENAQINRIMMKMIKENQRKNPENNRRSYRE